MVPCERNTDLNVRIFNRALPCERSLKADLDGTIFRDYRARLAYVMTFDHLHMSYGCRGSNLDDKIWREVMRTLVAHDSRKQKSYRPNRP